MATLLVKLLVLIAFVNLSYGQRISTGKCPTVRTKAPFNLLAYMGVWYEYKRSFIAFELFGKCARATYTLLPNGRVKVENKGINSITGSARGVVGEAYVPDAGSPGKLKVKFGSMPKAGDYWVLDTDYANFVVVYACKSVSFVKAEFIWVLSRTRGALSESANALAMKALEPIGTNRINLQDQKNCAN